MEKYLINQLINKKIILEQEKEIYCFGICQLIMLLLNICTSFFISLCYGRIIEGMIFSSAYILLRSYAGGYHAKTRKKCIYIFFFEILCCICFALLRKIQYASCISVACTITAFMLVIGKVK